jgi:hypothetical protein
MMAPAHTRLSYAAPHRSLDFVVQVQLWLHRAQLKVRLEVTVDRADVPPVRVPLAVFIQEWKRKQSLLVHERRNDIGAEIVRAIREGRITT